MAANNKATVHWEGAGKDGVGRISTTTPALQQYPYGFASRFEGDVKGTNPEELLGAAHAACFAMAFSFACDQQGLKTETVDTSAEVVLGKDDTGFVITRIKLTLRAKVPGADSAKFKEIAAAAKNTCPLSRALASVPEIMLDAEQVA